MRTGGLLTSSSVEGQGIEHQGSDLADPGPNGGLTSMAGVLTVPQVPCSTGPDLNGPEAAPAAEDVQSGGTTVPGHHSRDGVRGLVGIQGKPSNKDRKRQWDATVVTDPGDATPLVETAKVDDVKRRRATNLSESGEQLRVIEQLRD